MFTLAKNLVLTTISTYRMYSAFHFKKHRNHVLLAEIIRNTHSIEKGLCMQNMRLGFGGAKISSMLNIIKEYVDSGYSLDKQQLMMARSALNAYFAFHDKDGYSDDIYIRNKSLACKLLVKLPETQQDYGGSVLVKYRKPNPSAIDLNEFLQNRHSIREFSDQPLDMASLEKALLLARRAPSACNRQTTHVTVLDRDKIAELKDWLSGIGGFSDNVQAMLVLAGRMSEFNDGEIYQYIVNAGIYAGYLNICLNAYGIGSCVVQRPLLYPKTWIRFCKQHKIPKDESIVCMIAIGMPKDEYIAPVSHRLPLCESVRYL